MNYIRGAWCQGSGLLLTSENPASSEVIWSGNESTADDVESAVVAAREAFESWSALPIEQRVRHVEAFARIVEENREELAKAISDEVGKPLWDAAGEVNSMIGKIPVSIAAFQARRNPESIALGPMQGMTWYKPHGALCVFGPFNFPGHIANGLIVPALIAGNTIVFKPSELTPSVAERTVRLWQQAGLPDGVLNLVQGGRTTGAALVEHPGHSGVLFTGSLNTAVAIRRALVERPEAIVVLELGGNNPLVVNGVANLDAAVYHTIQSAFVTSGQRCTCARRLIVPDGNDGFLDRLAEAIPAIVTGRPSDRPEPFCGSLVNEHAADRVLEEQQRLVEGGGKLVVPAGRLPFGSAFVSPGLIDVTDCTSVEDHEVFGPLLTLTRVKDLKAAIAEANNTRYGLVAALFGDDRSEYELFRRQTRAGLINWNRPTTGASGRLPFGGVGASGNHRPAGYFAADFCNAAIGSLETESLTLPESRSPGLGDFSD